MGVMMILAHEREGGRERERETERERERELEWIDHREDVLVRS